MSVTTNAIGMINFIPGNTISSLGPWVVSKDANWTNYTSIQNAINDAHAAGPTATDVHTVYIKGGTYTENLTLYPYVNLVGSDGGWSDVDNNPVILNGDITLSSPATACVNYITNMTINLTTSISLTATLGTSTLDVNFLNCKVNSTTSPIFALGLTSNSTFTFGFNNCQVICSANKLFSYTGTTLTGCSLGFTFNYSYVSIQNTQVDSGQVVDYSVGANYSNVALLSFNNSGGEHINFSAVYSAYAGALTNGTNLEFDFKYCYMPGTFSVGASGGSAIVRLYRCIIGLISSTSQFTYASGTPIDLIECTETDNAGIRSINKNFATFSFSERFREMSQTTTSNATPTVLLSIPIPASMSSWVRVNVVGTNSAHTDTTGGEIRAVIQCTGAAMNIINQTRDIGTSSSGDVTLVTNFGSGTLDVTVTGIAATTYYWVCTAEWQKVSTGT